jgi:hypothetical protein
MGTQREAEEFINLTKMEITPDINFSIYISRADRNAQNNTIKKYNNFNNMVIKNNNNMGNYKSYNGKKKYINI